MGFNKFFFYNIDVVGGGIKVIFLVRELDLVLEFLFLVRKFVFYFFMIRVGGRVVGYVGFGR